MTIDRYIKNLDESIDAYEIKIRAEDGLPGIYYDAKKVESYRQSIKEIQQIKELLLDCKSVLDERYKLIESFETLINSFEPDIPDDVMCKQIDDWCIKTMKKFIEDYYSDKLTITVNERKDI